jgi:hypothetical protein
MITTTLAPDPGVTSSELTPEQAECLAFAHKRLRSTNGSSLAIEGYAGCGKTFLIAHHLIPELQQQGFRVGVTAFTNRAVKVVRGYLKDAGTVGVMSMTTSVLLGFRELPPEGKKPPRFEKVKPSSTEFFDVVVVDEASMLPPEHFAALEQEVESRSGRRPLWIIYVGDPAQLPPVGMQPGRLSPAMELPEHRIARLTTVMRTGGAVLDAATAVRESKAGASIGFRCESSGGTSVVVHGNRQAARHTAEQLVDQLGGEFRILAWTNQCVDTWNRVCRDHDLGTDAPPFVVGERLITRAPIWDFPDIGDPGASPICSNGTEIVVLEARQREVRVVPGEDGTQVCWEIKGQYNGFRQVEFYALEQGEIASYQNCLQRWRTEAVEAKGLQSKKIWREYYYPALRLWGHLAGPCYATTVHRAQGGQWDTVLVDLADVDRARSSSANEHQKLLYTAVTRAQRELHIMEA